MRSPTSDDSTAALQRWPALFLRHLRGYIWCWCRRRLSPGLFPCDFPFTSSALSAPLQTRFEELLIDSKDSRTTDMRPVLRPVTAGTRRTMYRYTCRGPELHKVLRPVAAARPDRLIPVVARIPSCNW